MLLMIAIIFSRLIQYFCRSGEGQRLQFGHLVKNVLQDTQQRLVFRAQAYIQSSIQKFIPQEEDLNYPARLKSSLYSVHYIYNFYIRMPSYAVVVYFYR